MSAEECLQPILDATEGMVSEGIAHDIALDLFERRQALEANGVSTDMDAELQIYAKRQADGVLNDAEATKARTVRDLTSLRRTDARVQAYEAKGIPPEKALLFAVEGTMRGTEDGRVHVGSLQAGYVAKYMGRWIPKLADRPELVRKLRSSNEFSLDVAEEILTSGGAGKSDDARFVAKIIAETFEEIRVELNRRGANIKKVEGYLPQRHNAERIIGDGFDVWEAFIVPRLKEQEGSKKANLESLRNTYSKITTGVDLRIGGGGLDKGIGRSNAMKRFGRHRELEFKDPQAWLEYRDKYGDGDVLQSLVSHIENASNKLALQDVLGSSPKSGVEKLRNAAARRIADSSMTDRQKNAAIGNLGDDRIDAAVRVAMREHLGVPTSSFAKQMQVAGQTIRTIQSVSKLGSATISALFGDLATSLINANFHGKPFLNGVMSPMVDALNGMPAKKRKEVAYYLGHSYEGLIGSLASRFDANDGMRGKNAKVNEIYHKLTFLTQVTEAARGAQSRGHAAWLGQRAGKVHNNLPPKLKHALKMHGIGKREWEVIRGAAEDEGGGMFLMPHKIRELGRENFEPLIPDAIKEQGLKLARERVVARVETEVAALGVDEWVLKAEITDPKRIAQMEQDIYRPWLFERIDAKQGELETMLSAYYVDETGFDVLMGDNYTARVTTGGRLDKTWIDVGRRLFFQFWTFPIAYTNRVLSRAWHGGENMSFAGLPHVAQLIAFTTLAGAAAFTMKEIAKGNTPPDFSKADNIITAVVMGGGGGVPGDLLSKNGTGFRGIFETFGGPATTDLNRTYDAVAAAKGGHLERAGKGAARLALDNVPLKNVWYLRAAIEGLVLDELHSMLSPSYVRRKRKWRTQRGQQRLTEWWDK